MADPGPEPGRPGAKRFATTYNIISEFPFRSILNAREVEQKRQIGPNFLPIFHMKSAI